MLCQREVLTINHVIVIFIHIIGAPCLSFDVLQDSLGENREDFPLTCYIVAGTQAERGKTNHVIVMKMGNLHRTSKPKVNNLRPLFLSVQIVIQQQRL